MKPTDEQLDELERLHRESRGHEYSAESRVCFDAIRAMRALPSLLAGCRERDWLRARAAELAREFDVAPAAMSAGGRAFVLHDLHREMVTWATWRIAALEARLRDLEAEGRT